MEQELSISRTAYSEDDDDDETKRSQSNSISNEQTINSKSELSQSVTNSHKPVPVSLSKFESPKPRPIDKKKEEEARIHLQSILTMQPPDNKAIKSPSTKYQISTNGKTNNNHNNVQKERMLNKKDRNGLGSQSSSSLGVLSPTSNNSKFRSRTPEPDKIRKNSFFKRKQKSYPKSDGNSTDSSINNCTTEINNNNNELNAKRNGHEIPSTKSTPQIVVNHNNNNNNSPSLSSQSQPNGFHHHQQQQQQHQQKAQSPQRVIYRHPNYQTLSQKKLQYLRGKSMQWKDPFGEPWEKRTNRYRQQSPFKHNEHWGMQSVIFKSGEDMRQEEMAMQFIRLFEKIWKDAKLPLQLRPYSVIVTSPASGFVETVPNAVSISRLKHGVSNFVSLRKFFEQFYGPVGSPGFSMAQKNFVESMAGYSLVCYFLQIKDRHNGNILLTSEGRVVHIDFDFLFSNSPGGNIGFESAPFKLTEEYIEVMGGEENSEMFDYFKILLIRGFLEARKHVRKFELMSKIMLEGAPMPCFLSGKIVIQQLRDRFAVKLKNEKCVEHVYNLIEESSCNWRTVQYDKFQRITNNIL